MDDLIKSIAEKKAELDRLRPRAPGGLSNFEHTQDLELILLRGGWGNLALASQHGHSQPALSCSPRHEIGASPPYGPQQFFASPRLGIGRQWTNSKRRYSSNLPCRGSLIFPARREREAACARGSDGWNADVHSFRRAS